jgi:hypothetical protein
MTLNSTGPISLAGATTGQSIAVELGLSATGAISLNQAAVRTLAGVPSGAIVMPTNFYGKSNRVTASITISANTSNYTLNTAAVTGYAAGTTDVTLTINNGVVVSSTSTGSYAFTVASGWTAGDTLTIVNNGTILGRGGTGGGGGNGACGSWPSGPTRDYGQPGLAAGPALNVNYAVTMNNASGRIAGGGGGGGGGSIGAGAPYGKGTTTAGGGGAGGGIGNGPGGAGGTTAITPGYGGSPGSAGTLIAGGTGGSGGPTAPTGGTGGTYGSSGASAVPPARSGYPSAPGGAAGAAIVGNSNITYTPGGTGTRNGSIS